MSPRNFPAGSNQNRVSPTARKQKERKLLLVGHPSHVGCEDDYLNPSNRCINRKVDLEPVLHGALFFNSFIDILKYKKKIRKKS